MDIHVRRMAMKHGRFDFVGCDKRSAGTPCHALGVTSGAPAHHVMPLVCRRSAGHTLREFDCLKLDRVKYKKVLSARLDFMIIQDLPAAFAKWHRGGGHVRQGCKSMLAP